MCTGSKTDDQEPGIGIAESRHRPAPVLLRSKLSLPLPRYLAAMLPKARTKLAINDLSGESRK
jgi:hypothetical protein